jgi:hypothetical protein
MSNKYKNQLKTNHLWELMSAHPDAGWNWISISLNVNITFDIVMSNPNLPWNWDYLSYNPKYNVRHNHVEPRQAVGLGLSF